MAHHSYTDGIQYLSAARAISSNNPDYQSVPGLPAWKLAIGNLFSPFYMIKRSIDQILKPFDSNCFIDKDTPKVRDRCIILGEDINRSQFKKSCKYFGCSNIMASHALLGKSINEYMQAIGEKTVENVTFATTFSLKPYA